MAEKKFPEEEREQHIKSIEEQVKYLEETERELKTTMSTDEEKALMEEARNLPKPVQVHRRLFNFVGGLLSDERLKREAYSLKAQKRRTELLTSKDDKLVQSEYNRDEIRVVLIGKTGKGKSALGNNLLGYDQFTSKVSLKGITMECTFGVRYLDREYKLLVVDTPGLFDSDTPNKEMSKEITKCFVLAAPGPNIFIFVVSTERFSPEEKETLTNLQKLFGEEVIDHVIIVFTRKEILGDVDIKEFMKDADDILLDLLVKCKFRFAFINNRADPDDVRVDIDIILDLIFKTIGENDGNYYSYKDDSIIDDTIKRMIIEKEIEKEREIQQLKEQKQKLLDEHQEDTGLKKASESSSKERKPQESEKEKGKPRDDGFKKLEAEIHDVGTTLREISRFLEQINIGNEESGIEKIEEKYNNIHKLFSDQSKTNSEPSNNEYISMLIREVRGLKQKVNDLMAFLRENKTQKRSKEFAEESYSESDKTGQRMDSMEGRISQPGINNVNVNSRKEKVLEIDKRIKELENINVYYEVRKEIEKGETTKTFTQKVMEAAGVGAGITSGAAVVAGAVAVAGAPPVPAGEGVVAVGAGVAKAASLVKSWW